MEKTNTLEDLDQFTGTEHYYKGWCGVMWTDGVHYVANNGASWLITDICSYMVKEKIKKIPFQIWKLKVHENKSATLTMREDTHKPILVKQEYKYTDFPLKEIKFYLIDGVLLIRSEY